MAKVLKREDLDKLFSKTVACYMSKGLWISTMSMCGHQGEEGKVDLTDGKSTYRVLAYEDRDFGSFQQTYTIEVRKYDEYVTSHMHMLWNNDGELIETVCTVYEIEGTKVYVETEEEAKAIREVQMNRRKGWGSPWNYIPKFDANKVAEIVRATGRHGYKRIKAADIVAVERCFDEAKYRISITGNRYIVVG